MSQRLSRQYATAVLTLTLLATPAFSQRVAPLAVVRPATSFADTTSPPTRMEPDDRRRHVVGAAIGAVVGAAAGFFIAHSQASHTACTGVLDSACPKTDHYLLDSALGAVIGALFGIVIGGTN